jgi:hypothetical protein
MKGINKSKAYSEKFSPWDKELCGYFRAFSEKSHAGILDQ